MPCLVITGASSGIGLATAGVFVESGYEVINLSRSACDVDGVTNITCDLADPNFLPDIETTLLAGIAEAETLCLVHNAACLAHDCVADISPKELRNVYEINPIAPTVLNRTLLPSMSPAPVSSTSALPLAKKWCPVALAMSHQNTPASVRMRATCQDLAAVVCIPPASIRALPTLRCCVITSRQTSWLKSLR